jgi:hypothetical protein
VILNEQYLTFQSLIYHFGVLTAISSLHSRLYKIYFHRAFYNGTYDVDGVIRCYRNKLYVTVTLHCHESIFQLNPLQHLFSRTALLRVSCGATAIQIMEAFAFQVVDGGVRHSHDMLTDKGEWLAPRTAAYWITLLRD